MIPGGIITALKQWRIAIGAVVVAILAIAILWHLWQRSRSAATEAKLGRTQAEASVKSGKDAIETLGKATDREAGIDIVTKENADAIRSAPGADAPVDPAVRDAGLASLCRRASYINDPRCVQFTPAR